MKITALWFACVCGLLATASSAAAGFNPRAAEFLPGHAFTQWSLEDNRDIGATNIEVGWSAIHSKGFQIDLSTGLHALARHSDGYVIGAWAATVALTVPQPSAPYIELGFDLGAALGETLIDVVLEEDPERTWIEPGSWMALGMKLAVSRQWSFKLYYKQHFIEVENQREIGQKVVGFAWVHRFPRVRLEWWQYPP